MKKTIPTNYQTMNNALYDYAEINHPNIWKFPKDKDLIKKYKYLRGAVTVETFRCGKTTVEYANTGQIWLYRKGFRNEAFEKAKLLKQRMVFQSNGSTFIRL